MTKPVKTHMLKYLIPAAGGLGLILRVLLYTTGMDGRGLLVRGHWTAVALSILSLLVAVVLYLSTRSMEGSPEHRTACPASVLGAIGAFAAMAGIGITTVSEFSTFSSRLNLIVWVLGLCAAVAMGCTGVCRLTGGKPPFLLSAATCLYFTLRMVSCYQYWSSDPQIQDYCFYLGAYVALMLTAYHHAAFHADAGNHRALWFFSLAAVYLCCLSLQGGRDVWLLIGCAAWAFTNLTDQSPRPRRSRPELKLSEDAPQQE